MGAILAKTWWVFLILAIFSVFALIGYLKDKKTGMVSIKPSTTPPSDAEREDNIEQIKNNLANSDKSLNSMFGNANNQNMNNGVNNPMAGNNMNINSTNNMNEQLYGNQNMNQMGNNMQQNNQGMNQIDRL